MSRGVRRAHPSAMIQPPKDPDMKTLFATPAADPYGYHRGRQSVDRGGVLVAFLVALVAGVVSVQSLDSLAVGVVVGATLFALLAPLFSTSSR
jgi:hypothetical protein